MYGFGSILAENIGAFLCGPVAQLGARFHGMEEVIGSIPIRSTKYLNNLAEPLPNVWQQISNCLQPSHVGRLRLLSEAPRFG